MSADLIAENCNAGGTTGSNSSIITQNAYQELVENCAKFNRRLIQDRTGRMPFLDAQTGIAQNPGFLWRSRRERRPGQSSNVIWEYPALRWKRKQRQTTLLSLPEFTYHGFAKFENAASQLGVDGDASLGSTTSAGAGSVGSGVAIIAATAAVAATGSLQQLMQPSSSFSDNQWLQAAGYVDDISDPEIDDLSDDDYEEGPNRKKKKKSGKGGGGGGSGSKGSKGQTSTPGGGSSANKGGIGDDERPWLCEICSGSVRYKTRAGLVYHMEHSHGQSLPKDDNSGSGLAVGGASAGKDPHNLHLRPESANAALELICDFCLGNRSENKKTGLPEQLTACYNCGRAGHPTCLQFTPNMIITTRKYGWQCIECKSCAICGTSENDEQLLFCDDCDRGYHMYCLTPPLAAAPDGAWSCSRCQTEFGAQASAPAPSYLTTPATMPILPAPVSAHVPGNSRAAAIDDAIK